MQMKAMKILVLASAGCLAFSAVAEDGSSLAERWRVRFDLGGTIPNDPQLEAFGGPVSSGGEMELSPGVQFDVGVGYRITPWLTVEGELGFLFNEVDSVGNWSYPNSALYQMPIMANVVFEYPRGPFVPFAGVGAGGVYSSLTFGNSYYYYWEPSGSGTDFVPAVQAFGGVRHEFNKHWSLGLVYRFLATDSQEWDVGWWNGAGFRVGVDSVRIQSISLSVTGSF
jgi:opacity protein-like surface antigen